MPNGSEIWKVIAAFIIALLVSVKFYDLTNNLIPVPLVFSLMLFVIVFAVVIRLVEFL